MGSNPEGKRDVVAVAYSPEHREKIAPVQGLQGGIPWWLHLEAYDVYCNKYGAQVALIDLQGRGCRGGFSTGELDMFIPGWRDRIGYVAELKARAETAESALTASREVEKKIRAELADKQRTIAAYDHQLIVRTTERDEARSTLEAARALSKIVKQEHVMHMKREGVAEHFIFPEDGLLAVKRLDAILDGTKKGAGE